MISRRMFVAGGLAAGWPAAPSAAADRIGTADSDARRSRILRALEDRFGGRLGVAILDTADGALFAHRGDDRFPLCSTHKCLSAAFVLARVARGEESLDRRVVYDAGVLVDYSPVTGRHADARGLTVGELCAAAITASDNTAANLLLDSFGGPAALTAFLRAQGDDMTRLDRREPALNETAPGDPRDSTTPSAMALTLERLLLGPTLPASSRAQLAAWLVACESGRQQLRAGIPIDWRAGDKTGSGGRQATNDVAIFWPPGRPPLIVTAYYVDSGAAVADRYAVLAEIGGLAASV